MRNLDLYLKVRYNLNMQKFGKFTLLVILTPFFFTSCGNNPERHGEKIDAEIQLIVYENYTISYTLPEIPSFDPNLLEIKSSDTSLFNIFAHKDKQLIDIFSNLENKMGLGYITFTYDNVLLDDKISVSINHPTYLNEAMDAFTLAAIKKDNAESFDLTFNFTNNLDCADFDECLEIYSRRGAISYDQYQKGFNITNSFRVLTNQSYAFKNSEIGIRRDFLYNNLDNFNYKNREINNLSEGDLPIDSINRTLHVDNSEELFWAVEHGYRPLFNTNSSDLTTIYKAARDIYINQIDPSWDNFTKFRQLYEYLNNITYYDHYVVTLKNDNWWERKAYFLEGVFLDIGRAVCDGFSKAYALLCGIAGLPCFRSYGFYYDETDEEWSGHAWNYVQLNNNWYLVCPTWSKIDMNKNAAPESVSYHIANEFYGENISFIDYESFLTTKDYFKNNGAPFTDLAYPNIERSSTPYTNNIYALDKIDDGHTYYISNESDRDAIKEKVNAQNEDITISIALTKNFSINEVKSYLNNIINSKFDDATWLYATLDNYYQAWIFIRDNS